MSDISSATPQPPGGSMEMHHSLRTLNYRAKKLKEDIRCLKKLQIINAETMRDTINQTFLKIRVSQLHK